MGRFSKDEIVYKLGERDGKKVAWRVSIFDVNTDGSYAIAYPENPETDFLGGWDFKVPEEQLASEEEIQLLMNLKGVRE